MLGQKNKFIPPLGFRDIYNGDASLRDYIQNLLSHYFYLSNYKKLTLPSIERQSFFSSEIVGVHPWPGWHPKSLISLHLKGYQKDYESLPAEEIHCFLIPEGTTSVCRWLASRYKDITKAAAELNARPLRIFYTPNCFRNELLSKVSETKFREFVQVGVEFFGKSSVNADIEVIDMAINSLNSLGFDTKQLILRVSDVRIFNEVIKNIGISVNEANIIKELLDNVASARAKGLKSQLLRAVSKLDSYTSSILKNETHIEMCKLLYRSYPSLKDVELLVRYLGKEVLKEAQELVKFFRELGVQAKLDFGVVRSQDYYNKCTFQIDIQTKNGILAEVAGGGRYDLLINRVVNSKLNKSLVPATGYAYSLERIIAALKQQSLDTINKNMIIRADYEVDYVIFSNNLQSAYSLSNSLKKLGKVVEVIWKNNGFSPDDVLKSYPKKTEVIFLK